VGLSNWPAEDEGGGGSYTIGINDAQNVARRRDLSDMID
jgi:hypothetical protein